MHSENAVYTYLLSVSRLRCHVFYLNFSSSTFDPPPPFPPLLVRQGPYAASAIPAGASRPAMRGGGIGLAIGPPAGGCCTGRGIHPEQPGSLLLRGYVCSRLCSNHLMLRYFLLFFARRRRRVGGRRRWIVMLDYSMHGLSSMCVGFSGCRSRSGYPGDGIRGIFCLLFS